MKKPFTYLKSAPQIPVGHIGGGNFTTINRDLLLRLSCMLCPLIVGAAFFVSSCQPSSIEDETPVPFDGTTRADSAAADSLPPGYVRIGDLIVNTNWDGEINVEY